ncbi:MAG: DUF883 family protein [Symbiobacteriia bacterium]
MATTSTESIAEALKLLEEAAQEKKDELVNLASNKYTHLKTALVDAEHVAAETLSASQKREINALIHATQVSTEKVTEAATTVNDHVHANPWPYIGGAAVVSLLAGYILGRKD